MKGVENVAKQINNVVVVKAFLQIWSLIVVS